MFKKHLGFAIQFFLLTIWGSNAFCNNLLGLNILKKVQNTLQNADSFIMGMREETPFGKKDVTVFSQKNANGDFSIRIVDEHFYNDKMIKPTTSVKIYHDHKVYLIPNGVNNIAVELKYEEKLIPNMVSSLFSEDGITEIISENDRIYKIKNTYSNEYFEAMLQTFPKKQREQAARELPSLVVYDISKPDLKLVSAFFMTGLGKTVKRVSFFRYEINCKIPLNSFQISRGSKIYIAKEVQDLVLIQKRILELLKKQNRH